MGKFSIFTTVPDKENGPKPEVAPAPIQKASITPVVTPVVTSQPEEGNTAATIVGSEMTSEQVVDTIIETLIAKNLPGPDYIELKNNASALGKTLVGIPEEQILSAAFNVLKNQYPDLTKETILKSIDKYIGFVEEERRAGAAQSKKLRAQTVGEKEVRLKQLEETAKETSAQIEALKKQLETTNTSIAAMKNDILTETSLLDAKERVFQSSVDSVKDMLTADKNKISTLNI